MDNLKKVLIVEDEILLRQGIKNLVDWESIGLTVCSEAANGRDALKIISEEKPDIVITDIIMPVMDGIELTKAISKDYPEIKVLILSSYSDFEYVKTSMQNGAVDYLLKPTLSPENLLRALENVVTKLGMSGVVKNVMSTPEKLLQKLVSGFKKTDDRSDYSVFDKDTFILAGTDIQYIFRDTKDIEKKKKTLDEITKEIISLSNLSEEIKYYSLVFENRYILLLFNFSKIYKLDSMSILKRIFTEMDKKYKGSFFGYSNMFYDIQNIRNIYQSEVLPGIEERFYYSEMVCPKEVYTPSEIVHKFNFKKFSSYLETVQIDSAISQIKDFCKKTIRDKSAREYELKSILQNSLYQMISILEDMELDSSSLYFVKQDYYTKIGNAKTATELLETIDLLAEDFSAIMQKYELSSDKKTMYEILDYIDVHYSEPLTLSVLADNFSFNYSYLSSYFSSHSNESFSEYLNKVRIEKACELLRKDNMPIVDVCTQVGFTDHSYFSKVFKKLTNLTPKQFRQKILNDIEDR